jgi:predicted DNA-binding WGR domain protein
LFIVGITKEKFKKFCSMLRIHLEARHPFLSLIRVYIIELTQDLFGDWIIETTYGRLGSRGQTKLYAFKTVEDALPKITSILTKRASAPQRSGCHYQLITMDQDPALPFVDVRSLLEKSASPLSEVFPRSKKISYLPLFDG